MHNKLLRGASKCGIKHIDMAKTYTLPKILESEMAALTLHDPCDLVVQSKLLNDLTEEFEHVSFSPSESAVKAILQYSKSVEVRRSETILGDHVLMKN